MWSSPASSSSSSGSRPSIVRTISRALAATALAVGVTAHVYNETLDPWNINKNQGEWRICVWTEGMGGMEGRGGEGRGGGRRRHRYIWTRTRRDGRALRAGIPVTWVCADNSQTRQIVWTTRQTPEKRTRRRQRTGGYVVHSLV
jgi:hypothetical protein